VRLERLDLGGDHSRSARAAGPLDEQVHRGAAEPGEEVQREEPRAPERLLKLEGLGAEVRYKEADGGERQRMTVLHGLLTGWTACWPPCFTRTGGGRVGKSVPSWSPLGARTSRPAGVRAPEGLFRGSKRAPDGLACLAFRSLCTRWSHVESRRIVSTTL
jgi:hypothetical protein